MMSGLDGVQLHLVETLDEAMAFKRWLGERHEGDVIGVDTETTGLDPRAPGAGIRLIQFGDTQRGWAIPWEDWRGLALEALREWDGITAYHNCAFEYKWLDVHSPWKPLRERSVDTMIAANIIDPLGPGGLKPLSVKYVDRRAAAGQSSLDDAMTKNGWTWATIPVTFGPYYQYAALDTVITAQLWLKLEPQIKASYQEVFDLEMATRFIVSRMESRGVRVDLDYSQQKYDELSEYSDSVIEWGKSAYGINVGSNPQLARVITDLGGQITSYTPTGLPKVDKELLLFLSDVDNGVSEELSRLAGAVLSMRKARKWSSTYFSNFLSKNSDGYIHADIRTSGARTSRMSVSSPALQQLPSRGSAMVRKAFIPSDGHVFITCDSDQVEARIFAVLSGDKDLQQAFIDADATGSDFFTEIGKQVYAEPGFQKSDGRRGLLKNFFYGKLYGAGVETMAHSAGVATSRMQAVADTIDSRFPGIQKFIEATEREGMARKAAEGQAYVMNPLGRRLPADDRREYALTNYKIQSTAADALKQGLVRLDAAGYDDFMVLPIHDEILFDIPESDADQAVAEIPGLMSDTTFDVPLTASADGPLRSSWGEKYE